MSRTPTHVWLVLAAWAGLMAGVGIALRPTPVKALPAFEAETLASDWSLRVARLATGRPLLLLGEASACPCDGDARPTIVHWAQAEGVLVQAVPDLAGIALADAEGRLRYAGDPAALVLHCGGLRGFRAWWSGPVERPVLTAPCACA